MENNVYRNVNFKKRDYDFVNIVACELMTPDAKLQVPEHYTLCDKSILDGLTSLYIVADVCYWGYP